MTKVRFGQQFDNRSSGVSTGDHVGVVTRPSQDDRFAIVSTTPARVTLGGSIQRPHAGLVSVHARWHGGTSCGGRRISSYPSLVRIAPPKSNDSRFVSLAHATIAL
jgi:hypothetical protein